MKEKNQAYKIALFFLVMLVIPSVIWSQTKTVEGRVTNDKGVAVQGVTVMAKGANSGTSTSESGTFSLTVPLNVDALVVSGVGYSTITVPVTSGIMDIRLTATDTKLDEVVVIGYGTQKKGDLTAPVTIVNTGEMLKRTTATPMEALQGSVPGVQVVTTGSPGSSPEVRIRGIGSFNNSGPLYVVDGMFVGDIGFLNPNDIAEMSVLKDASGAAIYGVRAANGVVLITTKKGKLNMKTRITYNGYVGMQVPTNVLKMANGEQFTNFALQWRTPADSASVRLSSQLYGGGSNGLSPTTSTDWYNEILRKRAMITSQGLDIQGGSDKVSYSMGFNYTYQNGMLNARNDFKRYNIRLQMEAKALSWLKVGFTSTLNNSIKFNPPGGETTAFLAAFTASPLFPVYDTSNVNAFPVKFANSSFIGRSDPNAVALSYYNYDKYKLFQFLPSIYAEAGLWRNKITLRSQLSQLYSSGLSTNYSPRRNFGPGTGDVQRSHLSSTQDRNNNYILDNLVTYKDGIGSHHWTVLLGHSVRDERWRSTNVQADDIPEQEEFWYVGQGTRNLSFYGDNGVRNTGLSYFTRVTYDFENKYLLTATYRRDGSSKYQTKWGNFPSVGLGWVLSSENFMKGQKVFDFLKLRGSWGKLGNDGVNANAGYGIVTFGNGSSAVFGSTSTTAGEYAPGYTVNNFFSRVTWEVVTEWDGGIDFEILNRRLKGTADYYIRKTNGAAISRPFAFGAPNVYGNWADMQNSGFDFTLSWSDKIGRLGYQVSGNLSTVKNKVTNIGSLDNIQGGIFPWISEFPNRIKVGEPIQYFYGYVTDGIYQTAEEIAKDPVAVAANAQVAGSVQPGYFKFKDLNGNGVLDQGDRTNLGSYLPKITYGFNLSFNYSGFDLSIALQGVSGNKILNLNRGRFVKQQSSLNIDQKFYENLWTGAGSTNAYPSAYALTQSWNKPSSSFFVESGAYLRVQNIQAGYSFKVGKKTPVGLRLFATADRPFIFTNYSGFTPEITGIGYDVNVYPVSATYSFGVTATF